MKQVFPRFLLLVLLFLMFTASGVAQNKPEPAFGLLQGADKNPDLAVLKMVSSAYVARVCDDYMPWWQADLIALSSSCIWELGDHLIFRENEGYRNSTTSHGQNLHNAAIGILLNRVTPIILDAGPKIIKSSIRQHLSLRVDPKDYPKILVAVDI